MEDKLKNCLASFRKSHSTQHSLLTMLEKWKRGIDNGANVPALSWTFQRPLIQSTMTLCERN